MKTIQLKTFHPLLRKCIPAALIIIGGWTVFNEIRRVGTEYLNRRRKRKMLQICAAVSRDDVVTLHQFPPGKVIPNPSPFALKLETFFRLANIQYEVDNKLPKGEKDKSPWITLNGEHFTDSQLIIEMFEKKLGKHFRDYSEKQKAIGTMVRLMIEEHFYWGLILWRYVYSSGSYLERLFSYSPKDLAAFQKVCKSKYETFTWYQGVGRHTKDEVIQLMCHDLRILSLIIGDKPFLLGDRPCSDDCAVFGMIAQVIWADVGSPFETIIREELPNLKEYCVRMKETLWPDWEQVMAQ